MDELESNFAKVKVSGDKYRLKEDNYTPDILRERYSRYVNDYKYVSELNEKSGLKVRHQNPPEDITENIAKFIIHNYENDTSCKWAKSIGLNGDLYSDKYRNDMPIEIKSFTSNGPSSYGPNKKFGVLYFLDMRGFQKNLIILLKLNLNSNSKEWKDLPINKNQTNIQGCIRGIRPHIRYDDLSIHLKDNITKIYEGTFENIFVKQIT